MSDVSTSKPTRKSTGISEIACAADDNLFATALFERSVTTWSLQQQRQFCELDTDYDFGGARLCVLGDDSPVVFVGSYDHKNVSAYSAIDGRTKWRRQMTEGLGAVRPSYFDQRILVEVEGGKTYQLDSHSGETTDCLTSDDSYASSYAPLLVLEKKPNFSLWSVNEDCLLWQRPLESFGVLSVAFSPDAVLITEPCGPVRAFTLDGELLWSNPCAADTHVINSAWNDELSCWVGVEMVYETRGNPRSLVQWIPTGGSCPGKALAIR